MQARVDRVDIGRRDRDQSALVEQPLLEIGEVEGAVLDDRTAEARAVLRLRQRQFRVGKRIGGIEPLVAEVAVEARRAAHWCRSW